MKMIEYNEINFYIGQSAKDNWDMLDKAKNINQDYIWFHLDSFPSPYVIMYATTTELQTNINSYLYFGANLCKENSKYKNLRDLKILYIPVKKLTKGDKVGEVIISGKRNIIKL